MRYAQCIGHNYQMYMHTAILMSLLSQSLLMKPPTAHQSSAVPSDRNLEHASHAYCLGNAETMSKCGERAMPGEQRFHGDKAQSNCVYWGLKLSFRGDFSGLGWIYVYRHIYIYIQYINIYIYTVYIYIYIATYILTN